MTLAPLATFTPPIWSCPVVPDGLNTALVAVCVDEAVVNGSVPALVPPMLRVPASVPGVEMAVMVAADEPAAPREAVFVAAVAVMASDALEEAATPCAPVFVAAVAVIDFSDGEPEPATVLPASVPCVETVRVALDDPATP